MPAFNTFKYNAGLFGSNSNGVTVYSSDMVVFNGYSLSDGVINTCTLIDDNAPKRDLIDFKNPRSDGLGVVGDYWREKIIYLEGYIKGASWTATEAALETLKSSLRKREQYLDITRNGVVRRYLATWIEPDSVFKNRTGHDVNVVKWYIKFQVDTSFAMDRTYNSNNVLVSASPGSIVPMNSGTYKALPIFVIVANATTTLSSNTIQVQNTTTNELIKWTGNMVTGDVLVFDSEAQSVTLNGVVVDFKGLFPTLDTGANTLIFTVDGGTFNLQCTTKWKNRYL